MLTWNTFDRLTEGNPRNIQIGIVCFYVCIELIEHHMQLFYIKIKKGTIFPHIYFKTVSFLYLIRPSKYNFSEKAATFIGIFGIMEKTKKLLFTKHYHIFLFERQHCINWKVMRRTICYYMRCRLIRSIAFKILEISETWSDCKFPIDISVILPLFVARLVRQLKPIRNVIISYL